MTSGWAESMPAPRGPFLAAATERTLGSHEVRRLVAALDVVGGASSSAVLRAVAAAALDLVGGDTAVVGTVDAEGAVARSVVGDPAVGPAEGAWLPLEGSLLGQVARTARPLLCIDATTDPRTERDRNDRHHVGSSCIAPMVSDGVVVGTVNVLAREPGVFDELDLELLSALATAAAGRLHQVRWAADEAELRRTVLESLEEGVVVTRGPRHEVVLQNAVAATLFGLPPLLSQPVALERMVTRLVRPDGSRCHFDDLPPVRAGRLGRAVVGEVYRATGHGGPTGPDGEPGGEGPWLRISSVPAVDPLSGRTASVVTRVVDVTEERRAQRTADAGRERLRAAQAIAGLAWWEYDAVLHRYDLSAEMYPLLGLDPADGVPGHDALMAMLVPADTGDAGDSGDSGDAGTEQTGAAAIFRIVRADGQHRVIQVWSERDLAPDGELLRLHGVTLDVTDRDLVLRALAAREDQFRGAFDGSPLGMTMYDLDAPGGGRMVRANAAAVAMLGYDDEAQVLALGLGDLVPEPDVGRERDRVASFVTGSTSSRQSVKRFRHRQGHTLTVLVTSSVATGASGGRTLLSHLLDVTEQQRAELELAASERLFRGAFEDAPWGMALVSASSGGRGVIVRANQALADILDRPIEAVVGADAQEFLPEAERELSRSTLDRVATSGSDSGRQQRRMVRPDGSVVHTWVNTTLVTRGATSGDGRPHVLTHVVDVTSQLEHQQVLERMAMTDHVTGLANRSKLGAQLDRALEHLSGEGLALLLLDLDRFKTVNDSLGHQAGDLMLVEVAQRLRTLARPTWTVARLGGDEFVVMVEGLSGPDAAREAHEAATALLAALAEPYELSGHQRVSSSASVGIAFARTPGRSSEDLLREADMALYAAKDAGRNRYVVCDEHLLAVAWRRHETENRLRRALADGGLRVHLQPILDLTTGRMRGLEALVRLEDPDLGLLGPDRFIDVAEETDLITEVDSWVLAECVRLVAHDARFVDDPELRVAVNVSSRTLARPSFPSLVRSCLARHGVSGRRLLVEITESSLMDDDPTVLTALADLRATGAKLGIDDFGTGYSALAYLQRFELDVLKIDKSFVSRLREPGDRAAATVAAIVDLAHAHELVVVAEGVETGEQADMLREMGCDLGQGWLFGHPRP